MTRHKLTSVDVSLSSTPILLTKVPQLDLLKAEGFTSPHRGLNLTPLTILFSQVDAIVQVGPRHLLRTINIF
jgi:hypothetical protein